MKKLTILSIAVLLVLLTNQFTNAQTQSITVDTTITADCEFDPFTSSNAIHSLKISGNLTLNSDTSLVRIVLYDTLFNEYMVYESYHLIASEPSFNFYDVCDETCYLDSVSPYSLEVQIVNASLTLNTLLFEPDPILSVDSLQLLTKQAVEQQKIAQIQSIIDENEFLWFADTNTISNLNYRNKKSLFGEKYNMRGLDYYSGGIFMTYGSGPGVIDNSSIISEWD
ncbi:MAG: hypothetical protein DRJ05_15335 [Bacteroidetes bacterium]|nr:MAG: hypothetical protein DRJ05_15335 [Bacteroidota bacterium]